MTYWAHSDPCEPDHEDGQRPCACDTRCLERDHSGQPKLGPRAFCGSCQNHIARCLAWLPEAWVELHGMIGDKGTGQGERVASTRTPDAPLNLNVDSLLTDMAALLEEWANRVRPIARLHQPAKTGRRDAVIVEAAVKVLSPRLDVLLGLEPAPMLRYLSIEEADNLADRPDDGTDRRRARFKNLSGADAGLEILSLHGRAMFMLGLRPCHVDLPVPCWECGLKTVRRWDGSAGLEDQAECSNPNCRAAYTHERYMLLIRQVAEQQQAKGIRTQRKASA